MLQISLKFQVMKSMRSRATGEEGDVVVCLTVPGCSYAVCCRVPGGECKVFKITPVSCVSCDWLHAANLVSACQLSTSCMGPLLLGGQLITQQ